MKKTKFSFVAFLAVTSILTACDKLNAPKSSVTQTQEQPNQHVLPPVTTKAADPLLEIFNQSVRILPIARDFGVDKNKNEGSLITYQLENIGKKNIIALKWSTKFTSENQVIFTADMAVNYKTNPLEANGKTEIKILDLFNKMSQQAVSTFKDPSKKIIVDIVPKELTFEDGTKLVLED